ncbi:MAG: DoxX family protein [Ignavibacteria bacterium]|nr:DoxX family protein [Ignavibacteria bacterium]
MKIFKSAGLWFKSHSDYAYSLIRIFLGSALLIRGIILLVNPDAITHIAGLNEFYWSISYVITVHIVGGLLLAVGLYTRLAALLQIPVLFGAVFFVHLKQGLLKVEQSFELSMLVLVLLMIFFLFGSGYLSMDKYFDKKELTE